MKYLGYGVGRIAFEDPVNENYVIKYPYNNEGIRQNKEEYDCFLNHNLDGVYAECYLDENNCLHMEKLIDCSIELNRYMKGDTFICSKFDYSTDKTIDLSNCVKGCMDCKYKKYFYFSQENINAILRNKTKDRLQVGYDLNGNLKFYDYAITSVKAEDVTFLFNSAYVNLFKEYLTEYPTLTILFDEWVKGKTLPNKNIDTLNEMLMKCNYWKRKNILK